MWWQSSVVQGVGFGAVLDCHTTFTSDVSNGQNVDDHNCLRSRSCCRGSLIKDLKEGFEIQCPAILRDCKGIGFPFLAATLLNAESL